MIVGLGVFDNSWLKFLHCLLWRLGEIDTWAFHRVVYELSKEGILEINNWIWYGDSPRSAEVDAALALFEIINIVEKTNGHLKVRREPVVKCVFDDRVEKVLEKVLKKAKMTSIDK